MSFVERISNKPIVTIMWEQDSVALIYDASAVLTSLIRTGSCIGAVAFYHDILSPFSLSAMNIVAETMPW